MTDEAAFLAAVRAAPDDDLPRLVYADWLDEHGEADRAEFIRVQCELAGLACEVPGYCSDGFGKCGSCYRLDDLRRHAGVLYGEHGDAWHPADGMEWTWRRGFVEVVRCTADRWVRHADAVLARHPVRRVMFSEWPDEDSFGFNHEGVWLGEEDHGRIYPWADGEYPVRDRRVPIRRAFSSRWPGVGFEWPVEREDLRRDVDMGSVVR